MSQCPITLSIIPTHEFAPAHFTLQIVRFPFTVGFHTACIRQLSDMQALYWAANGMSHTNQTYYEDTEAVSIIRLISASMIENLQNFVISTASPFSKQNKHADKAFASMGYKNPDWKEGAHTSGFSVTCSGRQPGSVSSVSSVAAELAESMNESTDWQRARGDLTDSGGIDGRGGFAGRGSCDGTGSLNTTRGAPVLSRRISFSGSSRSTFLSRVMAAFVSCRKALLPGETVSD